MWLLDLHGPNSLQCSLTMYEPYHGKEFFHDLWKAFFPMKWLIEGWKVFYHDNYVKGLYVFPSELWNGHLIFFCETWSACRTPSPPRHVCLIACQASFSLAICNTYSQMLYPSRTFHTCTILKPQKAKGQEHSLCYYFS